MIQNIDQKTKRELIEIVKIQQEEYISIKADYENSKATIESLLDLYIPKVDPLYLPIGFRYQPFASGEVVEIKAPPQPLVPMYLPISRIELMFPIFCVCCAAIGCVFAFLVNV